jgi:hypothetical protein
LAWEWSSLCDSGTARQKGRRDDWTVAGDLDRLGQVIADLAEHGEELTAATPEPKLERRHLLELETRRFDRIHESRIQAEFPQGGIKGEHCESICLQVHRSEKVFAPRWCQRGHSGNDFTNERVMDYVLR